MKPSTKHKADWPDDALTDCYQAVQHILDRYGKDSPQDGSRTCRAGDLLLSRTKAGHTVVKFKGREVMRVPRALGSEPHVWDPGDDWVSEVDRLVEECLCH